MESTQKRRNSSPPVKSFPPSEVKPLPVDIVDPPSPAPAKESESPADEDDLADDETDDGDDKIPSVCRVHSLRPSPSPRLAILEIDESKHVRSVELIAYDARTSSIRRYSIKSSISTMGTRKSFPLK